MWKGYSIFGYMFSVLLKSSALFSFKKFFKMEILSSVMFNFPSLCSGQPTVCLQDKYESFTWSCGRETETINSKADYGVKHSAALSCYFKVRFTLLLIKASLALDDMYDAISMCHNLLCDSNDHTNVFTCSCKFAQTLNFYYASKIWEITALDIHSMYLMKHFSGISVSSI